MAVNPIGILNELLQLKYHSVARYMLTAEPYATPADLPVAEALERVAREDEEQARRAAELIEEFEGIPHTGLPDIVVAEIAYLSIRRMAEICAAKKEAEIAGPHATRTQALSEAPAGPEIDAVLRLLGEAIALDTAHVEALKAALAAPRTRVQPDGSPRP